MEPSRLSRELRYSIHPQLVRRRWVFGLSLVGVAAAAAVSTYQLGIVRSLPDPPIGPFDSSRVDASEYAYKRLDTPDGVLMLASYAVTAWLAAAGGADRARTMPWLPIAAALKTIADTGIALGLAREEWRENRALCAYCQAATAASALSVVVAVPEALAAIRRLSRT